MLDKTEERRQKAIKNAKKAYKLIEKKENYEKLLAAVETNVSEAKFYSLCEEIGLNDDEAKQLWKLIRFETRDEGSICW